MVIVYIECSRNNPMIKNHRIPYIRNLLQFLKKYKFLFVPPVVQTRNVKVITLCQVNLFILRLGHFAKLILIIRIIVFCFYTFLNAVFNSLF